MLASYTTKKNNFKTKKSVFKSPVTIKILNRTGKKKKIKTNTKFDAILHKSAETFTYPPKRLLTLKDYLGLYMYSVFLYINYILTNLGRNVSTAVRRYSADYTAVAIVFETRC